MNTVTALLTVTAVTVTALVCFAYCFVKTIKASSRISAVIMDKKCPLTGNPAVQRLGSDVTAPDKGPLIWCRARLAVNYCGVRVVGKMSTVLLASQCIGKSALACVTGVDTNLSEVLYVRR